MKAQTTHIRNLYERLKPEYKDMLDQAKEKYPFSINSLIKVLSENNSILDIKYGDIGNLSSHTNTISFNPPEILNLFEQETASVLLLTMAHQLN